MTPERERSRDELLALADELLAHAAEVRKQWTDLNRALRGESAPPPAARRPDRPQPATDDDPARMVAVEMMLAGRSRADVESHLRREFGDVAAAEVIARVYAEQR